MTDQDLIDVARYPNVAQAGLAKSALEEAGVPARVGGEGVGTWFSHLGATIGGVRLQVRRADRDRATRLLGMRRQATAERPITRGGDEAELTRAYRASVIGLLLFPLGLGFYALWLITRHQLYLPDRGGRDYRYYVALVAMVIQAPVFAMYWRAWIANG